MRNARLFCYKLILICLQIIIISDAVRSGSSSKRRKVRNQELTPDRMADIVLRRLRQNLEERKVESLNVDGAGPLEKGTFVGLVTIKRNDVTTLLHQNRTIGISSSLDNEQTKASFPCSVSIFGRNLCEGRATVDFRGLSIYLEVKVRDTDDGKPQLEMCDVSDLGDVKLSFTENAGPLGSIFSWASNWMTTLLRSRIATNLQDVMCNAIASNLT